MTECDENWWTFKPSAKKNKNEGGWKYSGDRDKRDKLELRVGFGNLRIGWVVT